MDYVVLKPNSDGNDTEEYAVVDWSEWTAYSKGEREFPKAVDRRKTEAEAEALAHDLMDQRLSGPGN
jgi:hypothetical protein